MRYLLPLLLVTFCRTAQGGSGIKFDASTPLYTRDSHAYAIKDLSLALDAVRKAGKPIVLFIHGRGDEPGKSLRAKKNLIGLGSAVSMLEDQYGTAVLMFNWDSKGASMKDRSRPLGNMAAAAEGLHAVILELQSYYSRDPSMKPVVLVAHSMGTIVVQRYVEKYGWTAGRIFSERVIHQRRCGQPGSCKVGRANQRRRARVHHNKPTRQDVERVVRSATLRKQGPRARSGKAACGRLILCRGLPERSPRDFQHGNHEGQTCCLPLFPRRAHRRDTRLWRPLGEGSC